MRSLVWYLLVACAVAALTCAYDAFQRPRAHADAASGTYTGSLSLRGNYYWERSTRVVAPEVAATVDSPQGIRVEGAYLLDAITSASQATGVQTDNAFTERRNEFRLGLGYELDFGRQQLDVSANARYSKEPDYLSRGVGFAAALSLNERNSVFTLAGYFITDDIYRLERAAPADDPTRLIARKPVKVEGGDLDALSLGIAWDQVLNRTSTLTLGYDLALLNGFQANAYRMVSYADGGGAPEKHPRERTRHAGYVWYSQFFPKTRSAIRGGYRLYRDDWKILAHALDGRFHQEFGPYVETRLRYRYYRQSSSYFYRPGGNLRSDIYITDDPKMTNFHTQTFGLRLRFSLDFLAFTALDFLSTALLDWSVEYIYNTNRYGNGVVAQGGLGWTF